MLEKINQIFGDIKDAIVEKGVEVDDCASPDTYADRIMEIETCSNETCDDGGSEGGSSTNTPKASYFFLPAYKRSSTKPTRPTWTAPFTANENNEIRNTSNNINLPSGWYTIDYCIQAQANSQEMLPLWVSYCAVRIYNSVVSSDMYYGTSKWTEPICLGYPYANTSGSWVGDGGTSIVNNGGKSKTFVIFANVSSSNITVYRPTGGTWNTSTNNLTGNITSDTSDGNTVYWYTSKSSASGSYTWVSIGTFGPDGKILGTWSDPFCINARDGKDGANGQNGQNGRDGVDGTNIEFIYKRCADMEAFMALTTPESDHYTTRQIPSGWTPTPSGIDCDSYKIEVECSRELQSNGLWGDWSSPAIRSICGGSGSGDDSGGSSSSKLDFTIEYWYKLSNQNTGILPPALTYEDPSVPGAGGWSKTPGNPTSSLPYLWCFAQINYNRILSNGFRYIRSDAYIVRTYNVTTGAEFSALGDMLNRIKNDISAKIGDAEADLLEINRSLLDFKATLESQILLSHLNDTTQRVNEIETTGTTELTGDGLWGMLTSYDGTGEDGVKKKAFSDIVLDAENAEATLKTGAAYFDRLSEAGIITEGDPPQIKLFATTSDVTNAVNDAVINVNSTSIRASVSKAQKCWEKISDNTLVPYTHHLEDDPNSADHFNLTDQMVLSDYENYMTANPPTNGHPSDGPFRLVPIVDTFSNIKQTADSIEASVQNSVKFLNCIDEGVDEILPYDEFIDDYNQYKEDNAYYSRDYEYYVRYTKDGRKYEVITTGELVSNIKQTADEVSSKVGRVNHIWRRPKTDGTYDYKAYAIPSNQSVTAYENSVTADTSNPNNVYAANSTWELFDWSPKMSVIDQTEDRLFFAVNDTSQYWVSNSANTSHKDLWVEGESADYVRFDYWKNDWNNAKVNNATNLDYIDWVEQQHSTFTLTPLSNSTAAIDVKSDSITQSVQRLDGRMTAIENTGSAIKLASSAQEYVWELNSGEYAEYDYFKQAWLATNPNPQTDSAYENWCLEYKECYEKVAKSSIGAAVIEHDHILLGVGDSQGNYDAAITIDKTGDGNGKIVLDANEVEVTNKLSAGIVESAFANFNELTTTKASISNLIAGSVTAGRLESIDSNSTRRVLIEDGKAEFSLWDATMNDGQGGWRKRIDIGIEGTTGSNQSLVLRFFDTNGSELYNLGPAGFKDMNGQFIYEFDHNLD